MTNHDIRRFLDSEAIFKDDRIPQPTLVSLWSYVLVGDRPGGFVRAVLENDFVSAASKADKRNADALQPIARHIYSYVPDGAWGDPDSVNEWISTGGHRAMSTLEQSARMLHPIVNNADLLLKEPA